MTELDIEYCVALHCPANYSLGRGAITKPTLSEAIEWIKKYGEAFAKEITDMDCVYYIIRIVKNSIESRDKPRTVGCFDTKGNEIS